MSTHELNKENNGKTIQVKKGDTIKITLFYAPSMGFKWVTSSYSEKFFESPISRSIMPKRAIPGAGGNQEFEFKIKGDVDEGDLKLEYQRFSKPGNQFFTLKAKLN
ncbi:inhibitor of cysteine peptidase [Anaeramoeba ignava]|uniref:Inhibitor of cysteine peptidase n=1 Tax=Anaeramoeba ignava TaxID=1746090 RepID=A0A9Q0R9P7_ANAIG|nr:inhibitor of cysteine peptidase [Anaeramoeba ignava]